MRVKVRNFGVLVLIVLIALFSVKLAEAIDKHTPFDVIAKNGMVAAAHPLAAQAGVDMLKKGGNAIDAAVATAFALNCVEPFTSGIGGGGFMLIRLEKTGETIVIDYREHAPAAATKDMYASEQAKKEKWSRLGGKAVAVPGTLMGLTTALEKYGTMSLAEVMAPAISHMENGFEVTETLSGMIKTNFDKLKNWSDPEKIAFFKEGSPLEPGDILKQPDLAKTYREIRDKGIEHFYCRELGKKIVDAVQAKGGIVTLDDLKNYKLYMRKPVVGSYRGYDIYSMCPPSSGGTHLIQILNIMENFDIANMEYHGPTHIAVMAEAMKMAFADRAKYMADPGFVKDIPLAGLTSKKYAKFLAEKIDIFNPLKEVSAGEPVAFEHDSTTHLSVVDAAGNLVALTQTINYFFGSGIVVPGTGIIMNDEMDDFSKDPESPNAPEPGKIPLSSMSPTIIEKDGKAFMTVGTPGATRIFTAMVQIISDVIDFGMGIDEAIEAPRMHCYSSNGKAKPIYYENRIPATTINTLKVLGNEVSEKGDYDLYFGGVQGIIIKSGFKWRRMYGGADSRRDGAAFGY